MSVWNFSDYRLFLKNMIRSRPKSGRGEIGRLAKTLGVNSTLVSQVLGGTRDFTPEQMRDVCEYFALSELDTDYLMCLLQKERSGTQRLKRYWQEKIDKLRAESLSLANRLRNERVLTDTERAIFYSSWQYSAVRLLTSIEGLQDPDSIARTLGVRRERVVEILRFLADSGLVVDRSGRFELGPQRTHLEKGSPFLARHHMNWRVKAMTRVENVGDDELMFTGPLSLSVEDYAWAREEIVALIQRISERVKDSKAERLSCLTIDWLRI